MMKRKKKLHINRDKKKFLGVCAGIADYLEVSTLVVRIIFVAVVLMGGWFLIPAYFICYYLLDNNSGEFKEQVTNNSIFKHFRNVDYKKTVYRNTEDGKFLGVCAGVADYLEIDVVIVRLVTFLSFFVAGPIPWVAYFAAYFILDTKTLLLSDGKKADDISSRASRKDTASPLSNNGGSGRKEEREQKAQREKFKKRNYSKRSEFRYCARKFSNLHDRLVRMEAFVTSKQFKLHQQFKDLE